MPEPTTEDRMLTAEEVREQLGIKKTKFYELVNSGQIEAFDINGVEGQPCRPGRPGPRRSLRVRQSEVNRFLAERRVSA